MSWRHELKLLLGVFIIGPLFIPALVLGYLAGLIYAGCYAGFWLAIDLAAWHHKNMSGLKGRARPTYRRKP